MPRALTVEEKKAKILASRNEAIGIVEAPSPVAKGVIRKATDRPSRTTRGVFNGSQGKLKLNDNLVKLFAEAGWHLHIFNDTPGRVEEALKGGYEFVTSEEIGSTVVNNVVSGNKALDDKVKFLVGVGEDGNGLYAYLMKTPTSDYEDDQALQQKRNDHIDNQIKSGKNTAANGSSEGFYNAGTKLNNKG